MTHLEQMKAIFDEAGFVYGETTPDRDYTGLHREAYAQAPTVLTLPPGWKFGPWVGEEGNQTREVIEPPDYDENKQFGYSGFFAEMLFDADGNLTGMGVWE